MGKINQHIEIISSTTTTLSSMSKISREAIHKTLSKHYKHVGITIVNNMSDLESLVTDAPDLVFLGMKYIYADNDLNSGNEQKIWLAEYLTKHGIATTGSQSDSHELELDKTLAKERMLRDELKTSQFYVAKPNESVNSKLVPSDYPLFVKPSNRGGGAGIDSDSVVYNFTQLQAKIAAITEKYNADSLIEKYLPGREFSVAILKNEDREGYAIMPIELVAPADERGVRMLSSKVKSADAEQIRKVNDANARQSVSELAINAFRSLGGRDYGRIDIRMDEHGVPHFLEANLIPSLINNYGSFPKACALNIDLDYEDMLLRIVNLGMERAKLASDELELIPGAAVLGAV